MRYSLEDRLLKKVPHDIRLTEENIAGCEADMALYAQHKVDGFAGMTVSGTTYGADEKKNAGVAILAACMAKTSGNESMISDRPALSMVMDMAKQALAVLPPEAKPILHSDQGWQYQHKHYQKLLKDHGIVQSMSRKGNCLDNAVMENFFGILKSELLYLKEFDSIEQFKQELIDYLDYYNNRRIKAKLKGLPPAVHRKQALHAA